MYEKTCTKCNTLLPIKCFPVYKGKSKSICRTCLNTSSKQWRLSNKEQIKSYNKQYRSSNQTVIKEQRKQYRKNNRSKINEYEQIKLQTDITFKLAKRLRNRLNDIVRQNFKYKRSKLKEYLGCSLSDLKIHIESLFQVGMTWDNYGEWHIDHIKPLSSANTEEELYSLNHYTNLQPLWAIDNIKKSNK